MKMMGSGALAVGLLVVAGAVAADTTDAEAAKKEYARFEGTWKFVSIEVGGEKTPENSFEKSRLILEGSHFTLREGGGAYKGTFTFDLTTKPKQIDITFTEGPEKGKTSRGIYELDGDTYKICISVSGKDRPTAFVSKPGSGHILEVLHREPAAGKEDAIKKEMAKLEGTWQLVSAETDGKQLPEEQAKQIRVVIKGTSHTVYFGDKAVVEGVAFRVDPTTTPKQVEDTLKDGKKIRGIYELDGDTLRSCVAPPEKGAPTEFTGKAGSGQTLRIFKRVKE
jgi:uncharacterized protein (TIGR03067 family)